MRYGIAVGLLLASHPAIDAFQLPSFVDSPWSGSSLQRRTVVQQVAASAYATPDGPSGNATASGLYLASLVTDAVQTDDDAEEIELAERRRKITERFGSYRATLPLSKNKNNNDVIMGMAIRQFSPGPEISDQILNLDSLSVEMAKDDEDEESESSVVETISASVMQKRLDPDFAGLYVSSVIMQSPAWNAGIRPGDLLTSTASTFGGAMWSKTTMEGVRSSLTSRRMTADTATFEFKRTDVDKPANVYELTLSKPIGLNLRETEDGYVEVVGFTPSAPTLVRRAIRQGDRVVAVDSSLGDQMWPVSTVEGVISACTSRLPGQQVTLRFERPDAIMELSDEDIEESMAAIATQQQQAVSVATIKDDQKQLLKRCRDILRRYASEEQAPLAAGVKFVDKFAVPALVADRVLEALAKSEVSMDCVTLSMTMDAYLSCGQPDGAIGAFEAAVGVSGDGSSRAPKLATGETKIQASSAALNPFTISSLLRAHAMKRDLKSVRRVVAAMEGRGGEKVSGLEAAQWPGTGSGGLIVPDTQCYNIAISAAAKAATSEGMQLAMKLFDSLEEPSTIFRVAKIAGSKPEKNAVTYNSVIGALTMSGRFEDAFNVFFQMKRVGLKPDKFTYTSLLKACVNDGDLQELLIDMKEQGVKDDVVMYNTMIRSLCDEGKLAEAKALITQMESQGLEADSKTYGILLKGLLKANKPGACLALFETACNNKQTSDITENVFLYTTAVTAASALGDHERALDLVSRMTALGIKPNLKTLTAVMGACLANRRADLAAEVYKRIDSPDGYAMSQGLQAFCRSGDLEGAAKLLSSQKRGSRSLSGKELMQGYETIVTTAVRNGKYEFARRLFTELLEKSYIPSKNTLRKIIGAMGLINKGKLVLEYVERDSEQFQYLLFLVDSMEKRKLAVDAFLYAATIACGNQLGGRQREVALLLVQSKAAFGTAIAVEGEDNTLSESLGVQWEEVMLKDDIFKKLKTNSALLPNLAVTVGKRDAGAVFFAEKFLSRPKPAEEKVLITQ